ncbi:helix-turn-helix domain-containing protein [Pimelobacter simplex]|uniref:helix-turn-helix domain-containing protein n=1 Tax=Nocardioides simplex TaxID=2045 RepID=UPI00215034C6|nr:helix-turn-helix transcriptional regulator [Pimelobacter simplex]UUW92235.1 helix-turn-helix domain-containing protein [Pimelobacter simplex]UUW96062.1 helix-turn-helix domain-containing protein [Pimelobacter simplex]
MSKRAASYEQRAHRRAFGESVAQLRRQRGWTQEELAERAELHRSYIAAIETGGRNPTLDVIVKIATGLHVRVSQLFE